MLELQLSIAICKKNQETNTDLMYVYVIYLHKHGWLGRFLQKKSTKYCYMTCFEKIIGMKLSIFLKYDPEFV